MTARVLAPFYPVVEGADRVITVHYYVDAEALSYSGPGPAGLMRLACGVTLPAGHQSLSGLDLTLKTVVGHSGRYRFCPVCHPRP